MKQIIIAIDGFSSCGKSTIARALASRLGYAYIDSGAMYRAVTLYFLRHNISLDNVSAVQEALSNIHIEFKNNPSLGKSETYLNGDCVEDAIRSMYVSNAVSEVSALKQVRTQMVLLQQQAGANKGIVMDGRDIGTNVFPSAELKIFVTADPQVRAQRRFAELQEKGTPETLENVLDNLSHRDQLDTTRAENPLVQASDARILDNTNLNREEQLNLVLTWVDGCLQNA